MELRILDQDFQDQDFISSFESLIWTDRYNKYGDFEVVLPVNLKTLKYLLMDNYYLWLKESEHQMIIESFQITTDVEKGAKLTITGRSIECILDRRIIWNQSILTGNFQDAILKLLNENIINPTDVNRKISNFIFERSDDPTIDDLTINAQFTGDNLYDAISNLCIEKNIGFRVYIVDKTFVFKLYSGVDRSYSQTGMNPSCFNPYVIFSPAFENLVNSNYIESSKTLKNTTLIAGEGEGYSRRTTYSSIGYQTFSGLSRREIYTDARDISSTANGYTLTNTEYVAQLAQRGNENLAKNVVTKAFEGQAETSTNFKYGRDFFMGDIVQIKNEYGIESQSRVTELINSQNSSGTLTYPTFSTVN